jgi:hypothetical protein
MATTTCKRCGRHNLVWAQSKKGNWYLSDPKTISTNTYGNHITIPFAHKCASEDLGSERNESFLFDLLARSGA